ncbi:protein cip2a-like [Plakobranchus ocellatus]|uniref:Protein cip2a-like n=1 Tax=Plakobranchus ocellatus TaxID=259542 RepID=A0AAV3XYK4_9GAST|nr:protein cip2a-like [Plakobranchus ocellatus]
MEQANCLSNESLREVLRASSQYQHNPSPSQLCYLLKELEALQSVCSRSSTMRQIQSMDQIEWIECLTFLVDVIREKQSPLELVRPVLKILYTLAQGRNMQKLLYETFNICPLLAGQIVTLSSLAEEESSLMEALKLIQKLTYGRRVDYHQDNMENLLKFLVDVVLAGTEPLISPVLGTLANLCRNNVLVQSAIKNSSQWSFKVLLKTLCTYFDNENQMLVISSLSTFTSLSMNDAEKQKAFFESSNVEHILQIIFMIMVNGFKTMTWKYAADLLIDLLRLPHMQVCIKRYRHLSKCMSEVLSLLAMGSEEIVAELFQVLLSLCSAPAVRQTVNVVLFSSLSQGRLSVQSLLDSVHCEQQQQQTLSAGTDPLLCCLHWAALVSRGSNSRVSCVALDFLIDSCQDCMCGPDGAQTLVHLIPALADILSRPEQTKCTDKLVRLIKLLSVLCSDKENRECLGGLLKQSVVSDLVEKQLTSSYISYAAATSPFLADADRDSKTTSGHCILLLLDLGVRLRKYVRGIQEYLTKILHDSRLLDVMAMGLTSSDQEHVGMALRLVCFAMGAEEAQPDVVLCNSVACLNNQKHQGQQLLHHSRQSADPSNLSSSLGKIPMGGLYGMDNKENHRPSPLCCSTPVSQVENLMGRGFSHQHQQQPQQQQLSGKEGQHHSLESLIERMEAVMEPKDSKSAEVIEIFEHHIKALQIKEEHLNNLLEAKALALTQADRVIAQLRSREAAHATEMKKLQSILKKSEGKIESTVSQMNDLRIKSEQLKAQLDQQLQGKADEIDTLQRKCSELTEKCGELQDKITVANQEKKSLSNMLEDLQKAHETLKEQYTISCGQSKQLEEERKTLSKQLKERDAALQKSSSSLQTLHAKYKDTEKERAELEKEKDDIEAYVDKLRDQLSSSENSCRLLQQRAGTLEGVNQEQGVKLDQQSKRITELEAELEKHNQIVSFITSMNLNTALEKMDGDLVDQHGANLKSSRFGGFFGTGLSGRWSRGSALTQWHCAIMDLYDTLYRVNLGYFKKS